MSVSVLWDFAAGLSSLLGGVLNGEDCSSATVKDELRITLLGTKVDLNDILGLSARFTGGGMPLVEVWAGLLFSVICAGFDAMEDLLISAINRGNFVDGLECAGLEDAGSNCGANEPVLALDPNLRASV